MLVDVRKGRSSILYHNLLPLFSLRKRMGTTTKYNFIYEIHFFLCRFYCNYADGNMSFISKSIFKLITLMFTKIEKRDIKLGHLIVLPIEVLVYHNIQFLRADISMKPNHLKSILICQLPAIIQQ